MSVKIALAGNPNCGKTTMFNSLTGASQYVGNWPGVTVEKKEGRVKGAKDVVVTDLPGIYSLSPYTSEEIVSRDYLAGGEPDSVINIVDATNIERNLYLTTQIIELGKPVVIALNMMDSLRKSGDKLDVRKLGERLGCRVVETVALHGKGVREVATAAAEAAKTGVSEPRPCFSAEMEGAIADAAAVLPPSVEPHLRRWTAIKLLERDSVVVERLSLGEEERERAEAITAKIEKSRDDDIESIVTNERYNYITSLLKGVLAKSGKRLTTSDKIDRVVTNRFLGIPIFLAVMWLVYYVAVATVGTMATDWANDSFVAGGTAVVGKAEDADISPEEFLAARAEPSSPLPEGVELDSFDEEAAAELGLSEDEVALAGEWAAHEEWSGFHSALWGVRNRSLVESAAGGNVMVGWGLQGFAESALTNAGANEILTDCIVNGVLGGLGAVFGFLPQMAILFLLLSVLEDVGYMVRIAFVMDRLFRHFGLSGKSFIPLLIGSGCGIPGIMASRTIENENDRRMTIMTTTWIPCGAKLPVIALMASVIATKLSGGSAAFVGPMMYLIGVAAVLMAAIMLKKTKYFHGAAAPFVMELPQYHVPQPKTVIMHAWERVRGFAVKAGTTLFLACLVMWFLSSYGFGEEGFGLVDSPDSLLAKVGGVLRYAFIPLGFGGENGGWQAAAASISGFSAKEAIVSTMGVLANVDPEVAEAALEDEGAAATVVGAVGAWFPTGIAAFSFLLFNLLDSPCLAAVATMANELKSRRWFWFAILFQNAFAYVVTLIVYQFGMLFVHGQFGVGTVAAIALFGGILFALFRPNPYAKADGIGGRARSAA